jgi:hypothetical protein
MPWKYRVIQRGDEAAIHEVFYRAVGSIEGWTEEPVFPRGDTIAELREDLARYSRALSEPVLVETKNDTLEECS